MEQNEAPPPALLWIGTPSAGAKTIAFSSLPKPGRESSVPVVSGIKIRYDCSNKKYFSFCEENLKFLLRLEVEPSAKTHLYQTSFTILM